MKQNAMKTVRFVAAISAIVVCASASLASANVKKEGAWPEGEKKISVDFDGSTFDGIKKIANEAGWSIVLPSTAALESTKTSLHVKDQAPSDVLEAMLTEGEYVAVRNGSLVRVSTSSQVAPAAVAPPPPAAETPVAPAPPVVPMPQPSPAATTTPPSAPITRGEDRVVTGSSVTIQANEVVHDVAVFGGNVDVYGTVTGDLVTMGGAANVHDGARIVGDATAIAGALTIEKGASVGGHTGVIGGVLNNKASKLPDVGIHINTSKEDGEKAEAKEHKVKESGSAFSRACVLFMFGSMLLALAPKRMERLKLETVQRPARSFAFGILGVLGFAVAVVALCVTLIGIPLAVVAALFGAFAGFAGMVAVLTVVGAAIARHKTENIYAHLAIGCALFFVSGLLPFVGNWITVLVVFIGIGVTVATRVGGELARNA